MSRSAVAFVGDFSFEPYNYYSLGSSSGLGFATAFATQDCEIYYELIHRMTNINIYTLQTLTDLAEAGMKYLICS